MKSDLLSQIQRLLAYPPIAFVRYVVTSYFRHGNARSAFYLAFTSLFAVVPMMTVVYSILALIPELKGMESKMQSFVFEHFVPSTGTQLEEYLHNFANQASSLTSIGVAMLFVTSVLMLRKIETSFNTIWHVTESRKGVNGFLLYWALLSLGPVMMGGAFAVSSYLASLKAIYDAVPLPGVQAAVLAFLPILLSSLAFSLAYIAIPNTRVPIRHGLMGGLIAAIAFDLARRAMTLFITLFPTYQLVYGAFAAVPLFLIWILVSWFILLAGAEVVQALTNFKTGKTQSKSSLGISLSILEVLYRNQASGSVEDETRLLQNMPWITGSQWETCMDMLTALQLVSRVPDGNVSLSRDLHKYTLAQLFQDSFGDAIELDLENDSPWQQKVIEIYGTGLDQCYQQWQLPLAELFEFKQAPN